MRLLSNFSNIFDSILFCDDGQIGKKSIFERWLKIVFILTLICVNSVILNEPWFFNIWVHILVILELASISLVLKRITDLWWHINWSIMLIDHKIHGLQFNCLIINYITYDWVSIFRILIRCILRHNRISR